MDWGRRNGWATALPQGLGSISRWVGWSQKDCLGLKVVAWTAGEHEVSRVSEEVHSAVGCSWNLEMEI